MPREAGKEEALKRLARWALIPAAFLSDRFVKSIVLDRFAESETVPVWQGIFHLTRVNNTGAAFGLWRDASAALAVFSALSVILILLHLADRLGAPSRTPLAWALVAGGALGNFYDRVALGYVVDYLDFRVWPVFNLADMCISAGVAWILFRYVSRPV